MFLLQLGRYHYWKLNYNEHNYIRQKHHLMFNVFLYFVAECENVSIVAHI